MPYVVTTRREGRLPGREHDAVWSRQAVATLPDAQRVLRAAVRDADWPRDIGGSNARQSVSGQIDDLMASGGNAIRLPDGRIIEVVAVDDAEYARAIDAGMNGPAVPGVAEGRPMRSEPRSGEGEESREPREHCACGGFWRGAIDGPYAVCASCGATREDPPRAPDPAPIRGRWTIWVCPDCGLPEDHDPYLCTMFPGERVEHGNRVAVVPAPDEAAIERGAQAVEDHRFPRVGWDAETDTYGVWFYREASDRTLVRVVTGYGSVAAAAQAVNGLVAEAVLRAALEPPA
jgi:hypothetical protein